MVLTKKCWNRSPIFDPLFLAMSYAQLGRE